MKFTVLTLFPEMVEQAMHTSILGRAIDNHLIELRTINIRDYTDEKHGRVDDYSYGGGAGMLMQAQPVYDAWKAATAYESRGRKRTVYVTPQGCPFTQSMAERFAREEDLVFLCGHYEGIDARVLDTIVTDYVSIGDYVLTGGELPAMVMMDAIARLVPGVLHNDESALTESFHRDLLEYPQYSRPEVWNGMPVPKVLLSGDHRRIEEWRLAESVKLTRERRPDLYHKFRRKDTLIKQLSSDRRRNIHLSEPLRRERAEILYQKGENVLLYDKAARTYLISGCDNAQAEAADAAAWIDLDAGWRKLADVFGECWTHPSSEEQRVWPQTVIAGQPYWWPLLEERFGTYWPPTKIAQACYTQRNPLPVRHKDIRLLSGAGEEFRYSEVFDPEESEYYVQARIEAGAMYGIYVDGVLAGAMGTHIEGSLGMLFIAEKYRNQGLGESLEAYCINRQLEQGMTPYVWVRCENEDILRLQERLGLYLRKEPLYYFDVTVQSQPRKCCAFPRCGVSAK